MAPQTWSEASALRQRIGTVLLIAGVVGLVAWIASLVFWRFLWSLLTTGLSLLLVGKALRSWPQARVERMYWHFTVLVIGAISFGLSLDVPRKFRLSGHLTATRVDMTPKQGFKLSGYLASCDQVIVAGRDVVASTPLAQVDGPGTSSQFQSLIGTSATFSIEQPTVTGRPLLKIRPFGVVSISDYRISQTTDAGRTNKVLFDFAEPATGQKTLTLEFADPTGTCNFAMREFTAILRNWIVKRDGVPIGTVTDDPQVDEPSLHLTTLVSRTPLAIGFLRPRTESPVFQFVGLDPSTVFDLTSTESAAPAQMDLLIEHCGGRIQIGAKEPKDLKPNGTDGSKLELYNIGIRKVRINGTGLELEVEGIVDRVVLNGEEQINDWLTNLRTETGWTTLITTAGWMLTFLFAYFGRADLLPGNAPARDLDATRR